MTFSCYPLLTLNIHVDSIDGARKHIEEIQKRLQYFIEMTEKNKIFGMVKLIGIMRVN